MTLPNRNPVHLYRSLLREAGYLFDPASRTYHADYIRDAFQRVLTSRALQGAKATQDGSANLLDQDDTHQLRRARQYLYNLERANQGYLHSIKNVLRMTYARKGKERREILSGIMAPAPSNDPTAPKPPKIYGQGWRPPPKFSALLRSQQQVQAYVDRNGRKIKGMPKIPTLNRWNRPFPPSRIKGILRKWYARQADLLMPPLQETQWKDVYQATVHGTTKTNFKLPRRRPLGTVNVFTKADDVNPQWNDILDDLVKNGPQRPRYTRKVRMAMGNPHHLTSRFLRRMMQQSVLGSTATTIADPKTGKVAYRWDSGVKPLATPAKPTVSQQASLFD